MMKEVDKFSGEKGNAALQQWIDKVDNCVRYGVTRGRLIIPWATGKFTGAAMAWWRSLDIKDNILTWNDEVQLDGSILVGLRTYIISRFTPVDIITTNLIQLKSCRPTPGKTMGDFVSTFNLIIASLPPIPDFIQQDYFLTALGTDLALHIQTNEDHTRSITTLQAAAIRLSTYIKDKSKNPATPSKDAAAASTAPLTAADKKAAKKAAEDRAKRIADKRKTAECNRCGKKGDHWPNNCPNPNKPSKPKAAEHLSAHGSMFSNKAAHVTERWPYTPKSWMMWTSLRL